MKRSGKVKGYQLSDGRIISREEGVALAKDGKIKGVGIAHNGDTVYLKSLPDDSESNNLASLPTLKSANIVHHSNIYLPHWKNLRFFTYKKR